MAEELMLQLHLPPRPAAVPAGRRAVRALEGIVGSEVAERFELCVSELVGNSVRHADLDGGERITIRVCEQDDALRLEVVDSGCGFVPPAQAEVPEVEDAAPTGGYGLFLVESLSDRWGIEVDGRTRVWCEADGRQPR